MNSALYEDYLALQAQGRRKDAGVVLDAFLRSFDSSEEREQWARTFLKSHTYGERIRHEIYAELIFPVLLAGSKRNDAWSLYWMAGTSYNLCDARRLYGQIQFKSRTDLLKDAYAIERSSSEVRDALLKSVLYDFERAAHEWPAAILWSPGPFTADKYTEIMSEVALARELDRECAFSWSIDAFERKVEQFKERLIPDAKIPLDGHES